MIREHYNISSQDNQVSNACNSPLFGISITVHNKVFATGLLQVRLRAWNLFSSLEVDVSMIDARDRESIIKLNGPREHSLRRLVKCLLFLFTHNFKCV